MPDREGPGHLTLHVRVRILHHRPEKAPHWHRKRGMSSIRTSLPLLACGQQWKGVLMSSEPHYAPGADMPGFVQELMDFVGFTEADIEVIRHSAQIGRASCRERV